MHGGGTPFDWLAYLRERRGGGREEGGGGEKRDVQYLKVILGKVYSDSTGSRLFTRT